MFKKYKRKILISVAFGGIVFLLISIYADFSKLTEAFKNFNWWYFPLILLLSLANYFVRFFKWQIYLKSLNIKLAVKRSLIIFFASFVMSVTPGKMGEIIKSYLLKEEIGTPVSVSLPIVLAERLTDFISIVLLSIIGAYVFNYGHNIILAVGIFFILLTILISFRKPSIEIINFSKKVPFIRKHTEKLLASYESINRLVKPKLMIISVFLSGVAWFSECLGLYIVLKLFLINSDIQVNILIATFIYGFSTLIGALAMLPGGLGATEAMITGLLISLKIPKNISAASTIIIRVATLWFAVLLGIVAVLIFEKTSSIKSIENLDEKLSNIT